MANIEAELYSQITTDAGVNSLIGTKLYPTHKPQGINPPYAVYHIIGDKDKQCIGGVTYLNDVRVQIDCYGTSYGNVIAVKNAVKNSIHGFKASYNINSYGGYDDGTEYFKKILDFKLRN